MVIGLEQLPPVVGKKEQIIIDTPAVTGDVDLCVKCEHFRNRTVADQEERFCSRFSGRVRGRVSQCSAFSHIDMWRGSQPFRQLQREAMFLVPGILNRDTGERGPVRWITFRQADEEGYL